MAEVFIGLGSNLGDSRRNILDAWQHLGRVDGIQLQQLSAPYQTEPVGFISVNWFVNAVGRLTTSLTSQELLAAMLEVEVGLGRVRQGVPTAPSDRTVDLDILYFGDLVLAEEELTLPHPEIYKRLFVLIPLCDIAPDFMHPVLGLTSRQMLDMLLLTDTAANDPAAVRQMNWYDDQGLGTDSAAGTLQEHGKEMKE